MQARSRLAADEGAGAGDLELCPLNRLAHSAKVCIQFHIPHRAEHDARPRNSYVKDSFGLTWPVKRTGDKRIVGDGIAKSDQACTTKRVFLCRQASRLQEHLRQAQYGIGINAGSR